MTSIALVLWVFLVVRVLIAVVNLLTRQWLLHGDVQGNFKVSVLIPARNEAHNIQYLLDGLLKQNYRFWEAIVYDDLSEDNTADIVLSYQKKDARIRLMQGTELPPGWLGKNYACHRLGNLAGGDYLLFLDADVRLEETLITDALAHMQKHRLELLSVFPQQIMLSTGEKVSVPIMNWALVSLLPLILTRVSANPALAAANGQHMLFRAATYKQLQVHAYFKQQAVEDISIARYMKQQKMRIHTLISNGQIKCRMYGGLNEAIDGFSKNVLAFFGNSVPAAILFMIATSLGIVAVYLAMGAIAAIAYLSASLLLRMLVAFVSKQNMLINVISAPIQQLVFCIMVIKAVYRRFKRKNKWKGRIISV